MKYEELTIEECFIKYHIEKIACICNGDNKQIEFCKGE